MSLVKVSGNAMLFAEAIAELCSHRGANLLRCPVSTQHAGDHRKHRSKGQGEHSIVG